MNTRLNEWRIRANFAGVHELQKNKHTAKHFIGKAIFHEFFPPREYIILFAVCEKT